MLHSFELPLCLLNKDIIYNNYSFVLPTYWFKSEQYKNHYKAFLKTDRFIVSDNGLFEGDSFTEQNLIDFINELQPNLFVIPDVWNDATQSLRNAKHWQNVIKPQLPSKTKLMAVIQCTDYTIGSTLYKQYIDLGIEAIAFNHSSTAYQKFFPHENLSVSKMMGRIYFINQLKVNGVINPNVWHHLLGSSIYLEFLYYKEGYDFIKSMDSSFPVILGCKGQHLLDANSLTQKPQEKIETWFYENLSHYTIQNIESNIKGFKNLMR